MWSIALKLAILILTGLASWTALGFQKLAADMVSLKIDVATLQSSKFTHADGVILRREIALMRETLQVDIGQMREALAVIGADRPWVKAETDEIKVELRELNRSVVSLESRIGREFDSGP
jgi:hypothetical protein